MSDKNNAGKLRAAMDSIADLSDDKPEQPKKAIDHIRTRKAKSGGYIHEHHHTHPAVHPMEQHISADQDAMLSHMASNIGDQTQSPDAGAAASAVPSV